MYKLNRQDASALRELANQIAEIASLPFNNEKKKMWAALNGLKPIRPMVYVDQLPWHELNTEGELTTQCQDPFWREIELNMRKTLYRFKHFPVDMVVENRIDIPMSIHGFNYGIKILDETLGKGDGNDIVSHKYIDQAETIEALENFHMDEIWVDRDLDGLHLEQGHELFDGIIPVRLSGVDFHAGVWDRVSQVHPPDKIIYEVIDEPELIKAIVKKLTDISIDSLEQLESLGLLDAQLQYIHCTGAYTDELPTTGFDPNKPRAKDCWAYGMAQILTTVSPAMHKEFEIDMVRPLYEKFGLMYYGCCEILHDKIDYIREINNVRKISISPWSDVDISADCICGDYVLSNKPNPAWICAGSFEEEAIRAHIKKVISACKRTNTPCEIILKDVSTLHGHPDFLHRWANLAMELVENA